VAERDLTKPRVRTRKGAEPKHLKIKRRPDGAWEACWENGGVVPEYVEGTWTDYRALAHRVEVYNNARA